MHNNFTHTSALSQHSLIACSGHHILRATVNPGTRSGYHLWVPHHRLAQKHGSSGFSAECTLAMSTGSPTWPAVLLHWLMTSSIVILLEQHSRSILLKNDGAQVWYTILDFLCRPPAHKCTHDHFFHLLVDYYKLPDAQGIS